MPHNPFAALPSRRNILKTVSGSGLLLFSESLAFVADFWLKKDASAWSPEEMELMKTKSPWSKKIHAELAGGGGGGRGAGGGGPESMDTQRMNLLRPRRRGLHQF